MATVEVSTWAELKAALQNDSNEGNTIKLTADIDMNEVAPTGDNIVMTYGTAMTLDGDNHVIRNLRTKISSPVAIFGMSFGGTGRTFTIKKLSFQNLILAGASFIGANGGTVASTIVLEDVRICGSRSGASYLINSNSGVTLTRCFVYIPWQGAGQSDLSYTSLIPKSTSNVTAVANYCWFREKYTGWTYNTTMGTYYPTASSANDIIPSFSFSMFKLNGCYIDGSMKIPAGYDAIGGGRKYVYYCELIARAVNDAYTPSAQNVFDCDLIADIGGTSLTENTIRTCGWSGVIKKNAQTTGGVEVSSYSFPSGSNMGGSITPIFATPAQMKDASWLSNAGFDIIIPSE